MRATALFATSLLASVCCCGAAAEAAAPGPQRFEALKFVSGFFGLDNARETAGQADRKLTVIGAGFSRTGTKSLEAALLQLGHKVYDTRSMLELGHVARWEQAAKEYKAAGNLTTLDGLLAEMEAKGYTATLDFPMNLYAPVFAKQRPAAKVLMSVRPTVDSWVEAWGTINEILGIFILRPWVWLIDMEFNKRIVKTLYDFDWVYPSYPEHVWRPLPWFEVNQRFPAFETEEARQRWKDLHHTLQSELEQQLPKERFTTFDVRSGWAPLLKFLEINDPALAASDFPRVNDRGSLQAVRMMMDFIAVGLPLTVLLQLWVLKTVACCVRRRLSPARKAKSS